MQHRLAALALAAVLSPTDAQAQNYRAGQTTASDPALSTKTTPFLSLPGIFTDFVRAGGGQFVELPNGTARLTGRVFADSNLYAGFLFDFTFTGRVDPADASYPPAGTPNLGLLSSAYTPSGAIDSSIFSYYTAATGKLIGVRNLHQAVLSLTSVGAVQLGVGANNRNGVDGLFGEFSVTVISDPQFSTLVPTGNAELVLDFVSPYGEYTNHPQVYNQSLTNLVEGRAMNLPGVADDYVFVPTADFTELADGSASLTGTLARIDDLSDSWDLIVTMSGRVDPGEASWPPAGSPVLQMLATSYEAGGGTLDPDGWHYYTAATGTMTGTGLNAGGAINLTQTAATQVGGGANNTNTYFGSYSSFSTSIVTQPTARTLVITGDVEVCTLTAVFPVLPFPSLTTPVSTPEHPTVTDQGLILEGNNLAWIELVGINFDLMGQGDASNFLNGWFRIIDNTHVEIHPRPGIAPGSANALVYNAAIQSNSIPVDLVAPLTPALYAEPTVGSGGTIHFRMHHGTVVGPAVALVGISQSLAPSAYPGIASLDIGNNFTDILLDPSLYTHDGTTGVAAFNYGPMSAALLGSTYYFQGMVVDIGLAAPPFEASNYWQVDFQ